MLKLNQIYKNPPLEGFVIIKSQNLEILNYCLFKLLFEKKGWKEQLFLNHFMFCFKV